MFRNHKIVVVTPAGRQKYMEVLLSYILRDRYIIDEWHLWKNTQNPEDIKYIENLSEKHPDFIKIKFFTDEERWKKDLPLVGSCNNIRYFFKYCIDKDTIYIRFDDDIVYIEPKAVENLVNCRLDNPEPFIIYPIIVNNVGVSMVLKKLGKLPDKFKNIGLFPPTKDQFYRNGYHPCDEMGCGDPVFAESMHRWFISMLNTGFTNTIKFDNYLLANYEYLSINSFCWAGKDFAKFDGVVDVDNEEAFMTWWKPETLGRPNMICGNTIVAHYAFWPQRVGLDKTDILQKYKGIV